MSKTLFQKIADREIAGDIVYEDDLVLAFRDIRPAAAGTRLHDNPAQLGLPAVSESPATAEANSTAAGAPEANASIAMVPAVDELTDEELEELLGELETIEAIPSAEPEVAAVGVSQDLGAAR